MPLRALFNNKNVHSFEYNDEEWKYLKNTYKNHNLVMPCCNTEAIPKSSVLNNKFFSHKSKNDCSYRFENEQQICFKTIIAQTAHKLGWGVKTEHIILQGDDSTGVFVDVLCKINKANIGFIYQNIDIDNHSIQKIKRSLEKDEIKIVWFNGKNKMPTSIEKPIFQIIYNKDEKNFFVEDLNLTLDLFVENLFRRNITWEPKDDQDILVEPVTIQQFCRSCNMVPKAIIEFKIYNQSKTLLDVVPFENQDFCYLIYKNIEPNIFKKSSIGKILYTEDIISKFSNTCYFCESPIYLNMGSYKIEEQHKHSSLFLDLKINQKINGIGKWMLRENKESQNY